MEWTANTLQGVVSELHSRFNWESDAKRWKTPEYWISVRDLDFTGPKIKGDCDDFALICRYELRKISIPNRLVFCYVDEPGSKPEERGFHVVNSVEGMILDVRSPWVRPQQEIVGYTWLEQSGLNAGDDWHFIGGMDAGKYFEFVTARMA